MVMDERRFLSLRELSQRTGRHPELLRQWCAGGRLPCQRIGRDWVVATNDISLVDAMPSRRGLQRRVAPAGGRVVLAATFAGRSGGRDATRRLRRRLRLASGQAASMAMQLAGADHVVVAATIPDARAVEARRILTELGGQIIVDRDERSVTAGGGRRA